MRLIAQPFFNMKMSFICMRMKNDLHIKGYPRFETEAPEELGNGLFPYKFFIMMAMLKIT